MESKINEWIEKRTGERDKINNELDTVAALIDLFPDLDYSIDRWKNVRYYSPSITERADKVHIHHSCGCCSDSPLIARPHIEVNVMGETIKVYNNSRGYYIGERSYNGGDHPDPGWRTKLKEEKLSDKVIERIESYFSVHSPCENTEEEDLLDEYGF